MTVRHASLAALATLSLWSAPGYAQSAMQFPDATETVPELIDLYDEADSACRLSTSGDVKVAVACSSRAIYGVALNERNWCKGRENEANAVMEWHECEPNSLRFDPLPEGG